MKKQFDLIDLILIYIISGITWEYGIIGYVGFIVFGLKKYLEMGLIKDGEGK